jgi:glycosyltransferase involved in cell wall biosynthesis
MVLGSEPLLSIGMPAYNSESFIAASLDSLIAQDYHNFELIISDDGSSDRTPVICRAYVATDKRIRYYRNEIRLGQVANFNRVFELSDGEYFMLAGDHDLWHPTYVPRCVSILESDSEVVLAYSRTMLIDSDGKPLGLTPDRIDTRGKKTVARFQHIMWEMSWVNTIYGVIRSRSLAQTNMCKVCWGFDHVLFAELSLQGSFAQIQEPLYYRRYARTEEEQRDVRRKLLAMDPNIELSKSIEDLTRDMKIAHLELIARAPLSSIDKLRLRYAVEVRFGTIPHQLLWLRTIARIVHRIAVIFIPLGFRQRIGSVFPLLRRLPS